MGDGRMLERRWQAPFVFSGRCSRAWDFAAQSCVSVSEPESWLLVCMKWRTIPCWWHHKSAAWRWSMMEPLYKEIVKGITGEVETAGEMFGRVKSGTGTLIVYISDVSLLWKWFSVITQTSPPSPPSQLWARRDTAILLSHAMLTGIARYQQIIRNAKQQTEKLSFYRRYTLEDCSILFFSISCSSRLNCNWINIIWFPFQGPFNLGWISPLHKHRHQKLFLSDKPPAPGSISLEAPQQLHPSLQPPKSHLQSRQGQRLLIHTIYTFLSKIRSWRNSYELRSLARPSRSLPGKDSRGSPEPPLLAPDTDISIDIQIYNLLVWAHLVSFGM